MEFPLNLRLSIEKRLTGIKQEQLKRTAQHISERYRNESGAGKKIVTTDLEALVYSLVRMPATFGAVTDVMNYVQQTIDFDIDSVLDVGAGTGAASWAIDEFFTPSKYTCLERENAMRKLGQSLMQEGSDSLKKAEWITSDLISSPLGLKADMVISSYVMNEMNDSDREKVLIKLWDSANKMLVIIEPGTPVGYVQLKKARDILISQGAHIAAPCPHEKACRLAENDWCHFTTRIQRSKIHKLLKEGDVPYEDEKYTYMAFTRELPKQATARILRHPYIEKGQISLELCTKIENKKVIVKKKAGSIFKEAKKSKCGDAINIE